MHGGIGAEHRAEQRGQGEDDEREQQAAEQTLADEAPGDGGYAGHIVGAQAVADQRLARDGE